MTDRMAAMGERENLIAELRAVEIEGDRSHSAATEVIASGILRRAADYIESLSAPVEDEEKVCEAVARAIFNVAAEQARIKVFPWEDQDRDEWRAMALSAMREYARRLRAPVGEPALTRLEVECARMREALALHHAWSTTERAGPDYEGLTRDTHPDGELVWRRWWDRQLDLCERATEATRVALLQAERSEGGSPSSPIQTSELEEAEAIALGCGGLK